MSAKITFFSVGNGDMTLVRTESGRTILIDINIRTAADDHDDDTPNVARLLRDRLDCDDEGRLYVDVLLVSHPDKDHCTGFRKHFHLGPVDEATSDNILIRELWSSPMVFRRASRRNVLCDDARAFNAEARRRVRRYRKAGRNVEAGDRILILGEDEDGRTDDLDAILVRIDQEFSRVNGREDESMTARLLGPIPSEGSDEDEALSKNNSRHHPSVCFGGCRHTGQVPIPDRRRCGGCNLGATLATPSVACGLAVLRPPASAAPLLVAQSVVRQLERARRRRRGLSGHTRRTGSDSRRCYDRGQQQSHQG